MSLSHTLSLSRTHTHIHTHTHTHKCTCTNTPLPPTALNSESSGDFSGGGTWFEALGPQGMVVDAEEGHAVAFAGPLRHAGYPITRGTRIILVLFCYVEGFAYGDLVNAHQELHGSAVRESESATAKVTTATTANCAIRPSGDAEGGYVIYQQTTELVKMLNRNVKSVLD